MSGIPHHVSLRACDGLKRFAPCLRRVNRLPLSAASAYRS